MGTRPIGRCLPSGSYNPTMTKPDYIIETRELSKEFFGFVAVSQVDLKVARYSIHALIGPNGAGKTTLFNLITKFLQPTRGSIIYNGRDITKARPAAVARSGMVRSFQISAIFPHMTVRDNVRIALQRREGQSHRFWMPVRSLINLHEEVDRLLADVGLQAFAGTPAAELSYGRKRALEVATTLALKPELLLLDEPTAGMDANDVERVVDLIKSVSKNRTVVIVEHNLSVVARLSDRVTVLTRGEIVAEGDYATVSRDPRVVEAYLGTVDA